MLSLDAIVTRHTPMIIVHHLHLSQSERIIWLCEELEISYVLRSYDRHPTTGEAPAAYKALHPMGLAPVLTDGDAVLAESGAIVEYVNAKYGNGLLSLTPDHPHFGDYLFWFHFANGTLMPSEQSVVISSLLGMKDGNQVVGLLNERSDRAFALVEQRLRETPHFT